MKRRRLDEIVLLSSDSDAEQSDSKEQEPITKKSKVFSESMVNLTNTSNEGSKIIIPNSVKTSSKIETRPSTSFDPDIGYELPNGIDLKKWQPKINLTKFLINSNDSFRNKRTSTPLEENDISMAFDEEAVSKRTSRTMKRPYTPVSPIQFDQNESVIRERSPTSAEEAFSKRIKRIRETSGQSIPKNHTSVKGRRPRKISPDLQMYEETRKKLHNPEPARAERGVRKLYCHGNSGDEDENKNKIQPRRNENDENDFSRGMKKLTLQLIALTLMFFCTFFLIII